MNEKYQIIADGIVKHGTISEAYLQRKLKITHNQARKILIKYFLRLIRKKPIRIFLDGHIDNCPLVDQQEKQYCIKNTFSVHSTHIACTFIEQLIDRRCMIVVVGGIKGGTGKTTVATNLAVMRSLNGKKLLLVDADEQKSTSIWANQRDVLEIQTNWSTISLGGKALRSQLERMKVDYDDIIIDVGGRETTSLRAAISIADIFLIPFKPRSLDIWTLGDVKSLITEMKPANLKLKTFAMINQADSKGSDNEDTISILMRRN